MWYDLEFTKIFFENEKVVKQIEVKVSLFKDSHPENVHQSNLVPIENQEF